MGGLIGKRPSPANPVGGQQREPDSGEMFLEVEEAEDVPVACPLQLGPHIHTKIKIDDPTQQGGNRIQNDNGVSERGRGYRTKAA